MGINGKHEGTACTNTSGCYLQTAFVRRELWDVTRLRNYTFSAWEQKAAVHEITLHIHKAQHYKHFNSPNSKQKLQGLCSVLRPASGVSPTELKSSELKLAEPSTDLIAPASFVSSTELKSAGRWIYMPRIKRGIMRGMYTGGSGSPGTEAFLTFFPRRRKHFLSPSSRRLN